MGKLRLTEFQQLVQGHKAGGKWVQWGFLPCLPSVLPFCGVELGKSRTLAARDEFELLGCPRPRNKQREGAVEREEGSYLTPSITYAPAVMREAHLYNYTAVVTNAMSFTESQ